MKTKNDFNQLLDCRLVHKDYSEELTGPQLKKAEQEAKKELIDDIMKAFNITGPIHEHIIDNKNGDEWYYSTSHAKGTTMIMFAKWPVGLDCHHKDGCPSNYHEYINSNRFNESEKAYYVKHNTPEQFLELWTAKEAFVKVYYIEHYKNPDFNEWKLIQKNNTLFYTNGKEYYSCDRGTSDTHIFHVCSKE